MKSLEDLIRAAAAEGTLSGLSITKTPSGQRQANRPSPYGGWSCSTSGSPVEALREVLGGNEPVASAVAGLSGREMEE